MATLASRRRTFSRDQRLCESKVFQLIFRKGQRFREACLMVYACPNQKPHGRLGVIVPKKVVALSTRRHQLKRIIRESFRLNQHHLEGYDVIVMMRGRHNHSDLLWGALDQVWHKISQWQNTLSQPNT